MENPRPPAGVSAPKSPRAPPTTFVRTDAATFKELVQRLTAGPLDDGHRHRQHPAPSPSSPSRPPAEAGAIPGHRLSAGVNKRVHESRRSGGGRRRFTTLRPRAISLPASSSALSPAASPGASPSTGFAGLRICAAEDDGAAAVAELNEEEEERAIKEKRFYLHPSPRPARAAVPELLPLFPLSFPSSSSL